MPEELLTLFLTGQSEEGNPEVLQRGINLFRLFVSDMFEECVEETLKNGCSVWDYLPGMDVYYSRGSDQVLNELWVDYLIRSSNA